MALVERKFLPGCSQPQPATPGWCLAKLHKPVHESSAEVAGILELGYFSIVVQLIRKPTTTEHHNKQFLSQGLLLPQVQVITVQICSLPIFSAFRSPNFCKQSEMEPGTSGKQDGKKRNER